MELSDEQQEMWDRLKYIDAETLMYIFVADGQSVGYSGGWMPGMNAVAITVDNMLLENRRDYMVDGMAIHFRTPPPAGSEIRIYAKYQ